MPQGSGLEVFRAECSGQPIENVHGQPVHNADIIAQLGLQAVSMSQESIILQQLQ
jgi:hypothetical protein